MKGTARTGPKYRQIADDLRERIAAGEYGTDSRLPAKRTLMVTYHAALATVDSALDVLRKEGRIETAQGSGTFVRQAPEPEPDPERAEMRRRLDAIEAEVVEIYTRMGWPHPAQQRAGENGKARHEQAG
jgi:DNA-binding GntR family transcriptional regulator